MSFGLFLKQQRENNGWTIKELADRLGFSSSYISQLENGARVPSQKQLAVLAKAYEIPEEELSKRWTEAKIQKVSIATNYKFNIKEVGEKRVHEAASKLEQGLEELKKTISTEDHYKVPVLRSLPSGNLDSDLKNATDFVFMPQDGIPHGHRSFGIRVSNLLLSEAGILTGDFVILDADAKPKNGDIVIMQTPDGPVMTYYHERGDHLELRPEMEGFKKTYHLKESKMIGRLVYHIKKY